MPARWAGPFVNGWLADLKRESHPLQGSYSYILKGRAGQKSHRPRNATRKNTEQEE